MNCQYDSCIFLAALEVYDPQKNISEIEIVYARSFNFFTFLSPNVGSHQQPFSSGHVFTHHATKGTGHNHLVTGMKLRLL